MRFRDQTFEFYDAEGLSATFSDVFEMKATGTKPFALSGMGEIREALLITGEWYDASCPIIRVLEKQPQAPGVFRDGNGQPSKYDRDIALPMFVKESERKFSWKEQMYITQPFEAWVSPTVLHRLDYYPSAGDLFKWRDLWRQVTSVKVDPTDYFHNTGFPMHIRVESALWTPELSLDGSIPCNPKMMTHSSLRTGDRAPDAQSPGEAATDGGNGNSSRDDVTQSQPPASMHSDQSLTATGCDCPIKVPQCYVKKCSYYSRPPGPSCGC